MRTFKPEDILKKKTTNTKKEAVKKDIDFNTLRKTVFFGVSFLTIVVFLFNFINISKAKNIDDKPLLANTQQVIQKVYGVAINIDGNNKIYVADTATAEIVLKEVEKANLPADEKLKIKNMYFKEKVTLKATWVNKKQVTNVNTAVNKILYGNVDVQKHVVKEGENLWSIARKNDMRVNEILLANPNIDQETQLISIGQEILLKKPHPELTVVAVLKGERKKTMPYDTKIVSDSKLARGKEKVLEEGKNGLRVFTYEVTTVNGTVTDKKILSDRVAEKPVEKVIAAGSARRTTRLIASRSGEGEGSGTYIWPKRGPITSNFGYRGHEFHTGLDIDGETGDAVVASAGGTVIMTGWNGGYGKTVEIDHGNGVITRYAHLSSYSVSDGEKIGRGEYIGGLGSTGRSTGSHLHFEVIVNGSQKNPLRYLN